LLGSEELGRCFSDGFGAGWGVVVLAAEVGETGSREGSGFVLDERGSCGVDALEVGQGALEGLGLEDDGELFEGEVVDVAEVEGGEVGAEEVEEEGAGEVADGVGVVEVSLVCVRRLVRLHHGELKTGGGGGSRGWLVGAGRFAHKDKN